MFVSLVDTVDSLAVEDSGSRKTLFGPVAVEELKGDDCSEQIGDIFCSSDVAVVGLQSGVTGGDSIEKLIVAKK